jgi:predicted RNase H-like HicB family nuclease
MADKEELLMKLDITVEVWKKGNWFIAKCPELDFISQGDTREEAKNNLFEIIQIQFEEMQELGTLDEYFEECGYERRGGDLVPQNEIVGFEKHSLLVA